MEFAALLFPPDSYCTYLNAIFDIQTLKRSYVAQFSKPDRIWSQGTFATVLLRGEHTKDFLYNGSTYMILCFKNTRGVFFFKKKSCSCRINIWFHENWEYHAFYKWCMLKVLAVHITSLLFTSLWFSMAWCIVRNERQIEPNHARSEKVNAYFHFHICSLLLCSWTRNIWKSFNYLCTFLCLFQTNMGHVDLQLIVDTERPHIVLVLGSVRRRKSMALMDAKSVQNPVMGKVN